MDQLRALRLFARVAEEGSFAGAARALDIAPAVVTRQIAELEAHLGARLLQRTTRRVALTDIGEAYLERARAVLADIDDADALAGSSARDVRGHLRVLAPPALAVHQLAKHLPEFHRRHPLVSIELTAVGPVESMDENHDVTLIWARKPLSGDFIVRRLARSEVVLCATPEYLDHRGRPAHPRDLAAHDVLVPPLSELQRGVAFRRGGADDDEPAVEVFTMVPRPSVLSTTHVDTQYAAALAGLGVAALPSMVAEDALLEHALERVLPQWRLFSGDIWAALPSRKHLPARTRVFVDFLVEIFGGEDRDPWLAAAGCETPRLAA